MKKIDLIKLIEGLGDEDNVLETLKEHEEIKGLIKPLDLMQLGVEEFKELLANNKEIKGYHTSEIDSAISKGVESFKKNKMPKHIEDALKAKSNEGKTPEQLELEELKNKITAMEKEKTRAEQSSKYSKVLNEKKLPIEFIDFILNDDEQIVESNISKIEEIIGKAISNGVSSKLGDNTYTPPTNNSEPKKMSVEDLKGMSVEDINKYWDQVER